MRRLLDWLDDDLAGKRLFFYIIGAPQISLVYVISAALILHVLGLAPPSRNHGLEITWMLPFVLFFYAGCEEIMYRAVPLVLAMMAFGKSAKVILVAAACSALFGFHHGSWQNIFIQGMFGFVLSLLFLKSDFFKNSSAPYPRNMYSILKATATTTTIHFLSNGIIALSAWICGATSL